MDFKTGILKMLTLVSIFASYETLTIAQTNQDAVDSSLSIEQKYFINNNYTPQEWNEMKNLFQKNLREVDFDK